jgi:hypothetical protein
MRNLILLCITLATMFVSCNNGQNPPQNYEHKVVEFQREDNKQFETQLNKLASNGWEYVGIITQNGTNGRYISFRKLKPIAKRK